jgi:hypothetical protein
MADSPAVRQRRRRARWKVGLGTAIPEFDWFVVTELVEGLLTERDIDDRRRVTKPSVRPLGLNGWARILSKATVIS